MSSLRTAVWDGRPPGRARWCDSDPAILMTWPGWPRLPRTGQSPSPA